MSSIETRLVSRKSPSSNIPSPSQPRQAGFFSSKVARRSVLLGCTALGLFLIISVSAIPPYLPYAETTVALLIFILGNGIILVGSLSVWKGRAQGIDPRQIKWAKYGVRVGGGLALWFGLSIVAVFLGRLYRNYDLRGLQEDTGFLLFYGVSFENLNYFFLWFY